MESRTQGWQHLGAGLGMVAAGAALAMTVGCAGEPTTVALEMNARLEGNSLLIDGTTDLPDGALLVYEVRHERYGHDPETPLDMIFTEGSLAVAGGNFAATVDLALFDPGELQVWVAFQIKLPRNGEQPSDIRARFGDRGERLSGPNVTELETGGKHVAAIQTVHR